MVASAVAAEEARALLSALEKAWWKKKQELHLLLEEEERFQVECNRVNRKSEALENALMTVETTLRLSREKLEDHLPTSMHGEYITSLFDDAHRYADTEVRSHGMDGDVSKPLADKFRQAILCAPKKTKEDIKDQVNGSLDTIYVARALPTDDTEVAERQAILGKGTTKLLERIETLWTHMSAYDAWCENAKQKYEKRREHWVRMKISFDHLREAIVAKLPPDDNDARAHFSGLLTLAMNDAEDLVDGTKAKRNDERRHATPDDPEGIEAFTAKGAITWMNHWNAVGKRSSATPLVRRDHVLSADMYRDGKDDGKDGGDDDDDDDYSMDGESDAPDEGEGEDEGVPPVLEEAPELVDDASLSRSRQPGGQPGVPRRRDAPPMPGNPGDRDWAGANRPGRRPSSQPGVPRRRDAPPRSDNPASPARDPQANVVGDAAAAEAYSRTEKLFNTAYVLYQTHVTRQLQQVSALLEKNNGGGKTPRLGVFFENKAPNELVINEGKLRKEWNDWIVPPRGVFLPIEGIIGWTNDVISTFKSEIAKKYGDESLVRTGSTKEWIDTRRREANEGTRKYIYVYAGDANSYYGVRGKRITTVARFRNKKGVNLVWYSRFAIGIVVSPLYGIPMPDPESKESKVDPALSDKDKIHRIAELGRLSRLEQRAMKLEFPTDSEGFPELNNATADSRKESDEEDGADNPLQAAVAGASTAPPSAAAAEHEKQKLKRATEKLLENEREADAKKAREVADAAAAQERKEDMARLREESRRKHAEAMPEPNAARLLGAHGENHDDAEDPMATYEANP